MRQWDFSEKEWARQDLLFLAFPESVRCWSAQRSSTFKIRSWQINCCWDMHDLLISGDMLSLLVEELK